MTPSKNLYDLIHTLSKSEKRHFKLIAQGQDGIKKNKYLSIFEALEEMKSFDEEVLKTKLKEKKLVQHLSANKAYLFQLILKSLKQPFLSHEVHFILNDHIESAIILQERGFTKLSLRQLQKAKELAQKAEALPDLIKIIDLQRTYEYNSFFNTKAPIDEYHEQQVQTVDLLKELVEIRASSANMYSFTNNALRNTEKIFLETYSRTINDYLPIISGLNAFTSKVTYYNDVINYFAAINQIKQAQGVIQEGLALWDKNPEKKTVQLIEYYKMVGVILRVYAHWRQYGRILKILNRLDEMSRLKESRFILSKILEIRKGYTLIALQGTCDFKEAKQYVPEVIAWLASNPSRLPFHSRKTLWFLIATTYFMNNEYKECMKWLIKLINEGPGIKIDIVTVAKLLSIVIHWELKNMDSVKYLSKDTRKYLGEKNIVNPLAEKILTFFEKEIGRSGKIDVQKWYTVKKECISIIKKHGISNVSEYFDFVSWISSKINKKSFAEELRAKIKPEK